jgi:regulator of ribonuclease activity A
MYSRSIVDRIKIQIEILSENISDFIRRHSLRTPLLVMAGIAVMMTLKNARATIDVVKSMSGSPFGYKKSSSSFYSPFGRTAGGSNQAAYGNRNYNSPYGSATGASNQFGTQGVNMNSQYGQQPQQSQQQQSQFGGMSAPANPGYATNRSYNQAAPSYNSGNLRGTTMAAPGTFGAAPGAAKYGASAGAQSVPAGLFHSFTSMASFSGQIETLSAPDAPGFVDQTLRSPGAGKVLVVDSGGSMNAIFDSSMVMVAQQNGWKGVILNGFVLDPQAMQALPFGIQALGTNPTRGMQMMGQRGVPLTIGGIMFNPGSWVNVDQVSRKWRFCNILLLFYFHG